MKKNKKDLYNSLKTFKKIYIKVLTFLKKYVIIMM